MKKRNLLIAGATGVVLTAGSVTFGASAFAADTTPTIKACVIGSTKEVVKLSSQTLTCAKGQTLITWNVKGLQGAQGAQGIPGSSTGTKGDKGDQGIQGLQGLPGAKGDAGVAGATILSGYGAPYDADGDEEGTGGVDGDFYLDFETGDLYGPLAGSWADVEITALKGAAGLQGEKGEKGDIGLTGAQGLQGVQGVKGDKGDNGKSTAILRGSGIPDDETAGVNGDYYLDSDTGKLYGPKTSNSWDGVFVTTLKGTQGIQGTQGVKGDIGLTGLTGEKGDKGDTGLTGGQGVKGDKGDTGDSTAILSGTGAPVDATGVAGDYYIDTVTSTLYGPKVGADWDDAATLVIKGAKGDTGLKGDTGAKGDTGDQGIQGVKGDKGGTGLTGRPGADGKSASVRTQVVSAVTAADDIDGTTATFSCADGETALGAGYKLTSANALLGSYPGEDTGTWVLEFDEAPTGISGSVTCIKVS